MRLAFLLSYYAVPTDGSNLARIMLKLREVDGASGTCTGIEAHHSPNLTGQSDDTRKAQTGHPCTWQWRIKRDKC